jgi:hypothetical protein
MCESSPAMSNYMQHGQLNYKYSPFIMLECVNRVLPCQSIWYCLLFYRHDMCKSRPARLMKFSCLQAWTQKRKSGTLLSQEGGGGALGQGTWTVALKEARQLLGCSAEMMFMNFRGLVCRSSCLKFMFELMLWYATWHVCLECALSFAQQQSNILYSTINAPVFQ